VAAGRGFYPDALSRDSGIGPALAGHREAVGHVVELPRRMRVRVDREGSAALDALPDEPPVQVHPVGRGIDLEGAAGLGRRRDDGIHVRREPLAREKQSAGRMAEDGHERIAHRADQPRRLLFARQPEARVHRRDHEIELRQELVAVVDRPVGEDVRLRSVEDPDVRETAPELPNLLRLGPHAVDRQPAGVSGGLAVVRDGDVGVAGRA
jgi:hypothetical protein